MSQRSGSRAIAALTPGAMSSGSVSVTIPAGTVSGTYYIVAVADLFGGDYAAAMSYAQTVIEDDAFIGSRCILTEGVLVGERAVLAPFAEKSGDSREALLKQVRASMGLLLLQFVH